MKKVIQMRLIRYIENGNLFPETMFGFRQRMSVQDVFLLLKEEVLNPERGNTDRFIVALDIKKGFRYHLARKHLNRTIEHALRTAGL